MKRSQLTIRKWLLRPFWLLALIFIVFGALTFVHLRQIQKNMTEIMSYSGALRQQVETMQLAVTAMTRSLNADLLNNDLKDRRSVGGYQSTLTMAFQRYQTMLEEDPQAQEQVRNLKDMLIDLSHQVDQLLWTKKDLSVSIAQFRARLALVKRDMDELKLAMEIQDENYVQKATIWEKLDFRMDDLQNATDHYLLSPAPKGYEQMYDRQRDLESFLVDSRESLRPWSNHWQKEIEQTSQELMRKAFSIMKFKDALKKQQTRFEHIATRTDQMLTDVVRLRVDEHDLHLKREIDHKIVTVVQTFLAFVVLSLCLGTVFYLIIGKVINKPIVSLINSVQKVIRTENFSQTILLAEKRGSRELNELGQSFNEMMETITQKDRFLRDSLNNMLDAFVLFKVGSDPAGDITIMEWNKSAQTIFGQSKEHVMGLPLSKVIPEHENIDFAHEVWAVFHEQQARSLKKIVVEIAEIQHVLEYSLYPVDEGVACICRDLTEQLSIEQKLLHAEKLAAVGQMAAGVAHDIGNPLTSLNSIVQILHKQAPDARTEKDLSVIRSNIERIRSTLDQLVQFSRVPQDELELYNLNRVISSVLSLIHYHHKMKTIQIGVECEEDPIELNIDVKKMEQVLLNVLVNAADAILEKAQTKPDEPRQIRIKTFKYKKYAVLEVIDNGVGLEPRQIKKVFEPFYSTKKNIEGSGTGLGLTLCRNIVEHFHGRMEMDSIPGQQTTITIRLPLG